MNILQTLIPNGSHTPSDKRDSPQRGQYALYFLISGALFGEALIVAFANTSKTVLTIVGVASMVAAASILAGALFGFIFGVPRTLQRDGEDDTGSAKLLDVNNRPRYRPNTNLEQISDWLTKILVGAGLTQIGGIRGWLRDLGVSLAPGFGSADDARVFATATVVCYALDGFLIGYLWTRLYFAGALVEADDLESLAREVKNIKDQNDLDAKALALAMKQMNLSSESIVPTQQELNDAIKDASQNMKVHIFYQAATTRENTWKSKKANMKRTIPIFRALIACDPDDAYHQNHGQLGWALKDQLPQDFVMAESELTKAIQIRGSDVEHHWVFYEMARAECRIQMDANYKNSKKSSSDSHRRIVEDLTVASRDSRTEKIIVSHDPFKKWMGLNGVTLEELQTKHTGF